MKKYLGVKIVEAEPMTNLDFQEKIKSSKLLPGVPFLNGYKAVYEDGYISWSPKDVFEKAYKELQEQDLGLSIVFLNTVSGNWRYSFEGEDTGANFNDEENLKRFCIGKALRLQGVTSKSELLEAAKEIYNWIKEL